MSTAQERTESEALTARDYLQPAWDRKWLILAFALIVTAATVIYSRSLPDQYVAKTQLFLQSSALDQLLSGVKPEQTDRATLNQSKLLESESVTRSAAKHLSFEADPEALLNDIKATPEEGSDFLSVSATREDPEQAQELANAVAHAFARIQGQAAQDRAAEALKAAEAQLKKVQGDPLQAGQEQELETTIRDLRLITDLPAANIIQVDPADTPTSPSSPKPVRNGIFAFLVSLLIGVAGAYLLGRIDRRLRRPEDIEEAYGWPVIATISHSRDPAPRNGEQNLFSQELREDFRSLRTNLELEGLDRPLRTIVVVSAVAGEGKSMVVRNLALAYGEAGMTVAVVEGDLRRPSLAGLFGVAPEPGLTDALLGRHELASLLQSAQVPAMGNQVVMTQDPRPGVATMLETIESQVHVLPSGDEPANPPAVLASDEMRALLDKLSVYDVVLVDSPPLLAVSDIVPLIPAADGVVVVGRLDRLSSDSAARMRTLLSRIPHARVLGVVVNDQTSDSGSYGYYRSPYNSV